MESLPDDPPPQALNNTDNIKPVNTNGGLPELIALLKLNLLIFIKNTNPLVIYKEANRILIIMINWLLS